MASSYSKNAKGCYEMSGNSGVSDTRRDSSSSGSTVHNNRFDLGSDLTQSSNEDSRGSRDRQYHGRQTHMKRTKWRKALIIAILVIILLSIVVIITAVMLLSKDECSEVAVIHYGKVKKTGSKYGSRLKVECYDGYEWRFHRDIICQTPDSWKKIPDCSPVVCERFVVPPNAVNESDIINKRVFKNKINVKCKPGYKVEGADIVTCQANKKWSTSPNCTMIECDALSDISYGTVTNPSGTVLATDSQMSVFPLGSTVEIECDDGYEIDGNISTLRCMENGTWMPNVSCIPVLCSEYSPPVDALFIVSSNANNRTFGSSLTIECKDGLLFADGTASTELTCNASKIWSGEQICGLYATFENDSYVFAVDNKDTIVCDVYGADVSHVVVNSSNETSLVNVTAAGTEQETGVFTVNQTSFQDTQTRVAVNVDLQDWCANGGVIGSDTYTCEVTYKNGNKISAETNVTVYKSASIKLFVKSIEIVEGKDTTAGKLFRCETELGNLEGTMEIDIDRNDDRGFVTFLTLNAPDNNTADGWIVHVTNTDSECGGVFQSVGFALRNVTKSLHLTSMRCAIKPPDDMYTEIISKPSVLKVVGGREDPSDNVPSIYFDKKNGTGIVGENYTMRCIVDNTPGLLGIVITKDGTNIIDDGGVFTVTNDINDISARLTIEKTIKCGDNGMYCCKAKGTSVEAQAETWVTVVWKSKKPTIDLSPDIVEDSPPWAGFETFCSAETGYNNASIYFQTNKNGAFETLTETEIVVIDYNPSECSNVKTISFTNQYTADWNGTTFRCVVQDIDRRLMDVEIIKVVPESICYDKPIGEIVPHPFDCRARFTCSSGTKKLIPYRNCHGVDTCYDAHICVACEEVCKCREDPSDIVPCREDSSDNVPNVCPTDTTDEVFLPHPSECEMYLWCYNSGTLFVQRCPAGVCFNAISKACDDFDCIRCLT